MPGDARPRPPGGAPPSAAAGPSADSVSIEALAAPLEQRPAAEKSPSEGGRRPWPPPFPRLLTLKAVVALFVLFLLVVSDVFTNNVLSGFRGAVQGRAPTGVGAVIQGVFLVGFYAVALYLLDAGIL